MYPDLSYFFHDILGTEPDNWTSIIKTFGLFLALTFVVSAMILRNELHRMEVAGWIGKLKINSSTPATPPLLPMWIQENLFNAVIVGLLLYKIPFIRLHFTEFKQDPASILFSSGGNILLGLFGFVGILGFAYFTAQKTNASQPAQKIWPHEAVGDIIIIAAIAGVIGSRLFSVIENWESFVSDPLGQLFSGSGLTIYGGLILAGFSIVIYSIRKGINTAHLADAAAVCLALGYGIGRMGCQFSGDGDWGIPNPNATPSWWFLPDWVWAYDYPRNVLREGIPIDNCIGHYCNKLVEMVYPTPIYEITIAAITFGILWYLRTKLPKAGMLFCIYLFLTGFARFFVESIRVNDKYDLLNLGWSLSQWLAIVFMLAGIAGFAYISKYGKKIMLSS